MSRQSLGRVLLVGLPDEWHVASYQSTGVDPPAAERRVVRRAGRTSLAAKHAADRNAKSVVTFRMASLGGPVDVFSRTVEAYGEVKSLVEWLDDGRCRVTARELARRLDDGVPSEVAIAIPAGRIGGPLARRRKRAYGELKTLFAWSQDRRCMVRPALLYRRVSEGWPLEAALRTPPAGRPGGTGARVYGAFGAFKTLSEWAADPRCQVARSTLGERIRSGMDAETAISRPRADREPRIIVAVGEGKSAAAWVTDPRCTVSAQTILGRLRRGWTSDEAVTLPLAARTWEAQARARSRTRKLTAFGEEKTLREWSADPRCAVSAATLLSRTRTDMTPEEAVTTPLSVPKKGRRWKRDKFYHWVEAFGERKPVVDWARDPRCLVQEQHLFGRLRNGWDGERAITTPLMVGIQALVHSRANRQLLDAFGESKTLLEWTSDPRCKVPYRLVQHRLSHGWPLEDALGVAIGEERALAPRQRNMIEAFGETKSVTEWAGDERCAVGRSTLNARLKDGWDPEKAIERPIGKSEKKRGTRWSVPPVTAWGESKATAVWARDPRCKVSHQVLRRRLAADWRPEVAISSPPGYRKDGSPGPAATHGAGSKLLTAFGETKHLGAWARDPRCTVSTKTLEHRIARGWTLVDALTEPLRPKRAAT